MGVVTALSLFGFFDERPAHQYLVSHSSGSTSKPAVRAQYDAARRLIGSASTPRAGKPELVSDEPDLRAIEEEMRTWPNFQAFEAYFGPSSCSIACVEIAPLLVAQIHVLADAARKPLESTGLAALVARCLRSEVNHGPADIQGGPGRLTITHPDLNVRAGPAGGWSEHNGAVLVGALLSGSPPWVQVMNLGGRFILRNGYHRAVQLGLAGVTHIPAVVITTDDATKLEVAGFPDAVLRQQAPPTIGHFIRGQATELDVYEIERVVEIRWTESQRRKR